MKQESALNDTKLILNSPACVSNNSRLEKHSSFKVNETTEIGPGRKKSKLQIQKDQLK